MIDWIPFILFLVLVIVVLWLLVSLPAWIAKSRKLSEDRLRSVRAMAIVGLFIWPLWIVALVSALLLSPPSSSEISSQRNVTEPDPAEYDGPGKYRIVGIDRESKLETALTVHASSRSLATAKAEAVGVIVAENHPVT